MGPDGPHRESEHLSKLLDGNAGLVRNAAQEAWPDDVAGVDGHRHLTASRVAQDVVRAADVVEGVPGAGEGRNKVLPRHAGQSLAHRLTQRSRRRPT